MVMQGGEGVINRRFVFCKTHNWKQAEGLSLDCPYCNKLLPACHQQYHMSRIPSLLHRWGLFEEWARRRCYRIDVTLWYDTEDQWAIPVTDSIAWTPGQVGRG